MTLYDTQQIHLGALAYKSDKIQPSPQPGDFLFRNPFVLVKTLNYFVPRKCDENCSAHWRAPQNDMSERLIPCLLFTRGEAEECGDIPVGRIQTWRIIESGDSLVHFRNPVILRNEQLNCLKTGKWRDVDSKLNLLDDNRVVGNATYVFIQPSLCNIK
jgi:hypothetical protein